MGCGVGEKVVAVAVAWPGMGSEGRNTGMLVVLLAVVGSCCLVGVVGLSGFSSGPIGKVSLGGGSRWADCGGICVYCIACSGLESWEYCRS